MPSDLSGFSVEALDGSIGNVDEASNEAGAGYVVVDTGSWIFGKKVMLPAGVIQDIDLDREAVIVNRTKDEIKNAPAFDEATALDLVDRDSLAADYGPGGQGYRDWPG